MLPGTTQTLRLGIGSHSSWDSFPFTVFSVGVLGAKPGNLNCYRNFSFGSKPLCRQDRASVNEGLGDTLLIRLQIQLPDLSRIEGYS